MADTFPAVKTRLVTLGLFLLLILEASACQRCAYDRLIAENWYVRFAAISFIVPLLVVANRLDVVRVAFLFIPYVALCVRLHPYFLFHVFAGRTFLAQLFTGVYALNLVGVGLLYLASRFPFFRWKKDKGLTWWQPLLYPVAEFFAAYLIS